MMKTSDILKSTNFTYNNLLVKRLLKYNLSLNEFLLLNYFVNYNIEKFDIEETEKYTSLNSKNILEAYNGLIEKNIIKIISKKNDKDLIEEYISLDDFYQFIDSSAQSDNNKDIVDKVLQTLEINMESKVSEMEVEVVTAWIDSGYTYNDIIKAIEESKYNGTCNLRFIDKLLYEWKNKKESSSDNTINEKKSSINNDLFDYDWLDEK